MAPKYVMTSYLDDMQLVRAFYEGDEAAFKELFGRHKSSVFNFAYRFIRNRPDAEDVASEVFVQLFHKKFIPTGEARVSTWFFTVARNMCLTKLRAYKRQVSFWSKNADGDDQAWEIEGGEQSAVDALKQREQASLVMKAISKLPEEQKEAILLREYHQKSYAEISEIVGCSLEKVKILIFRAREALRVELASLIKEA